MVELSPLAWLILACGGLLSGFVDSIAGGGGLIALPLLLAVGIPPHICIGTNKVQSIFGSGTATWRYSARGLIKWRRIWPGVVLSLVGAMAGAWAVTQVRAPVLGWILPFLLAALWFYVALQKDLGKNPGPARMSGGLFYPMAGSIFGFYDGFLGPGTGSFWTVSQVSLLGMDLKEATAATKPPNFASNLGALLIFLVSGQVLLSVGLVMAVGQIIGAWMGSRLVIRHRPGFIRPFFLTVVAATVIKLLFDRFTGS